jgi:hypothetical protein
VIFSSSSIGNLNKIPEIQILFGLSTQNPEIQTKNKIQCFLKKITEIQTKITDYQTKISILFLFGFPRFAKKKRKKIIVWIS